MQTAVVPMKSARGRLRLGLITSLPVKVTLFQASEENSGPTSATETNVKVARSQCAPCQNPCAEEAGQDGQKPTKCRAPPLRQGPPPSKP